MNAKHFLIWSVIYLFIFVSCTKNDLPKPDLQPGSLIPDCSGSFMVSNGTSPDTIQFSLAGLTCNFGDTASFYRNADTLLVYSSIVVPACVDDRIVIINDKYDSLFINIQERYMLADFRCNVVAKVNYGIKIPKAANYKVCILNGVIYKGF